MSSFNMLLLVVVLGAGSVSADAASSWHRLGRAVTAEELASWDIDVRPDGTGLPPGSGSVADGQVVYDEKCASCHGTFGESNDYIALVGGVGSLASDSPQRTVGSKLNYATTLWDYINRSMPFNNSKTLSPNEVYAVSAYVLHLNEIVPADAVLDQDSLPKVVMPNREGFTREHGMASKAGKADVITTACMQNCTTAEFKVVSELPQGFTSQMYGDIQSHFRRFDPASRPAAVTASAHTGQTLAQNNGCLACHDFEQARVGPAFSAIAARYKQNANSAVVMRDKIRSGGSGVWGSVPMPPQAHIPDGDLVTVVDWILNGASRQ